MALAGVKLDDGRGGFASNCFPVRSAFGRTSDEASGAWLIAHHAEQRRRFKAVLCNKPRTYSRIKEERKKSELQGTKLDSLKFENDDDDDEEGLTDEEDDTQVLDGFYLMKHCCVDDPADLCSINVAGKELSDVKEDDLALFENVAYVNAGENYLPFEAFRGFPSLRELEIPLNGLRSLKIDHKDFSCLEMLDLSYNNLSQDDLLTLGLLTHLKVLHLTGNNLRNLPQDLAMPYLSREKQVKLQRYSCLEVLLLDDNKLMDMTVFAALAGLPKLRHLNMAKNEIFFIPQLKSVEGRVVTQDGKVRRRPKSGRRSARRSKPTTANTQEASLVDLEIRPEEKPVPKKEEAFPKDEEATPKDEEATAPKEGEGTPEEALSREANVSAPLPTVEECSAEKEKTVTILTDETSFLDLMSEDFGTGDLSARIHELEAENTDLTITDTAPKLPPFPELRYINLSKNKICEEESLLAVAAWPLLVELDIYDNPLTTEHSGDPPLLRRFLHDRLGIKVNRKTPEEPSSHFKKAMIEIHPKKRKVVEAVPKVPKLSLEEKMMLALPPPAPPARAIEHGSSPPVSSSRAPFIQGHKKSVLPPILSTPKEEMTQAWTERIIEEEEEDEEEDSEQEAELEREASDTFFMTQVGDVGAEVRSPIKKKPIHEEPKQNKEGRLHEAGEGTQEVDDRYKGYELLLDIEELENEPELPPAEDIQGNIRALKHTLNHQLVYRNPAVELHRVKKMVQEFRRAPVPPAKPHKSYQERVDETLTSLKDRSTLDEVKLTAVLKNKNKLKKKFPEAEELLGQIQRRYNAVRVHSMRDVKEAKEVTENVLNLLPSKPARGTKTK